MAREIVVVHLGAGIHDVKDSAMYRSMCENACKAAKETLNSTSWPANTQRVSKAFHAVLAAISTFEDDPKLNCGYGSNLTLDQTVECDASVMDGKSKLFGGIGALEGTVYTSNGVHAFFNIYIRTVFVKFNVE
ncbi:hypothetical protein HMI54_006506 [Coelomomyces lativittatus]|nr:hypothetical protein HMI56_003846 [Coelomomyces lativittatus]KAJ1504871.1 hypothetical protein HMI54_006506 [Coelomomyces lativittatus]